MSLDLTTTINITNLDGLDNIYTLVFNKTANQYNFPMSFKLNGVNVALDIGGLTIYGPPEIIQPTSGNDVPEPGSDGGDDGVGGNNDVTYNNEYPTLPELTTPVVVDKAFDYIVCNEGVITPVSDTLKIVTAHIPYASLVIDILTAILTDVCEEDEVQPVLGFPDYYAYRPGIERPSIVYLYKEYINNTWQASTYSSTVHNPKQSAIDDIMTVDVPDKTLGSWMTTVSLTDGSRLKVTGETEGDSLNNYLFLLNQVESQFIPNDEPIRRIVSQNSRFQVKTVKCRQIEYYPEGKLNGAPPSIRRVIEATPTP